MTWKLWRALHTPPIRHPLFGRIVSQPTHRFTHIIGWLWPVGISLLIALIFVGIWYAPRIIMPALFTPSVAAGIGLVLFTGTIYGMIWSANISSVIGRLRGEGKYDLLCLSPLSPFSINWTVCTGYLYRSELFPRVSRQRARTTQLILTITAALIMPLFIGIASANEDFVIELVITALHIICVACAFQIDHMQSVIIGSLSGILAPIHNHNLLDTRLFATFTFLSLQFTSYFVSAYLGFDLLPRLVTQFGLDAVTIELLLPLARLLVFFLAREVIITLLWQSLVYYLKAHRSELDLLMA